MSLAKSQAQITNAPNQYTWFGAFVIYPLNLGTGEPGIIFLGQ